MNRYVVPNCRRDFLLKSGVGFGAVAMTALESSLRSANSADSKPTNVVIDPTSPMSARPPHFKPRAKSVIFLFMVGGPSQVDTFDYKPILQSLDGKPTPESIKKRVQASKHGNVFVACKPTLLGSPFKFRPVGRQGMMVSELFSETARVVDELSFIHSMQADSNNHGPASYQFHTGDIRPGKSSIGSWITYGLGSENQNLPGYVMLFDVGPLGGSANYSNGFLPPAFQPTRLRDVGVPALDLLPPAKFQTGRRRSLDLMRELNEIHRDGRTKSADSALLDARIASYELAFRMQSAALEIGDLAGEPSYVRKEYGLDHPDKRTQCFGRKCLMARRLVERGVRFVQLYDMPDKDGWDAHANLVENHVPRARWTDGPTAALIGDLKRRGLLDETLVIWGSEFGRTPMMQDQSGRQHNAAGFTVWLAGGGIKPGLRLGATDEVGLAALERPIQFRDLHATVLAALGVRNDDLYFEVSGRQERLTGVAGSAKIIDDLLT